MTSPSKLIPLEEAERIVRYELTGWADSSEERIFAALRALAVSAGGAETPGAIASVLERAAMLEIDDGERFGEPVFDGESITAARLELAELRENYRVALQRWGRTNGQDAALWDLIDGRDHGKESLVEAMGAELADLRSRAAERDSVVAFADGRSVPLSTLVEKAKLADEVFGPGGRWNADDLLKLDARYRALSATADSTEEKQA